MDPNNPEDEGPPPDLSHVSVAIDTFFNRNFMELNDSIQSADAHGNDIFQIPYVLCVNSPDLRAGKPAIKEDFNIKINRKAIRYLHKYIGSYIKNIQRQQKELRGDQEYVLNIYIAPDTLYNHTIIVYKGTEDQNKTIALTVYDYVNLLFKAYQQIQIEIITVLNELPTHDLDIAAGLPETAEAVKKFMQKFNEIYTYVEQQRPSILSSHWNGMPYYQRLILVVIIMETILKKAKKYLPTGPILSIKSTKIKRILMGLRDDYFVRKMYIRLIKVDVPSVYDSSTRHREYLKQRVYDTAMHVVGRIATNIARFNMATPITEAVELMAQMHVRRLFDIFYLQNTIINYDERHVKNEEIHSGDTTFIRHDDDFVFQQSEMKQALKDWLFNITEVLMDRPLNTTSFQNPIDVFNYLTWNNEACAAQLMDLFTLLDYWRALFAQNLIGQIEHQINLEMLNEGQDRNLVFDHLVIAEPDMCLDMTHSPHFRFAPFWTTPMTNFTKSETNPHYSRIKYAFGEYSNASLLHLYSEYVMFDMFSAVERVRYEHHDAIPKEMLGRLSKRYDEIHAAERARVRDLVPIQSLRLESSVDPNQLAENTQRHSVQFRGHRFGGCQECLSFGGGDKCSCGPRKPFGEDVDDDDKNLVRAETYYGTRAYFGRARSRSRSRSDSDSSFDTRSRSHSHSRRSRSRSSYGSRSSDSESDCSSCSSE